MTLDHMLFKWLANNWQGKVQDRRFSEPFHYCHQFCVHQFFGKVEDRNFLQPIRLSPHSVCFDPTSYVTSTTASLFENCHLPIRSFGYFMNISVQPWIPLNKNIPMRTMDALITRCHLTLKCSRWPKIQKALLYSTGVLDTPIQTDPKKQNVFKSMDFWVDPLAQVGCWGISVIEQNKPPAHQPAHQHIWESYSSKIV